LLQLLGTSSRRTSAAALPQIPTGGRPPEPMGYSPPNESPKIPSSATAWPTRCSLTTLPASPPQTRTKTLCSETKLYIVQPDARKDVFNFQTGLLRDQWKTRDVDRQKIHVEQWPATLSDNSEKQRSTSCVCGSNATLLTGDIWA